MESAAAMAEAAPLMDAAIPATWPSGSMARAFRLPNVKPMETNKVVDHAKNTHTFINPRAQSDRAITVDTTMPMSADLIMMRMPNRMTSRALTMLAGIAIKADAAKKDREACAHVIGLHV